MGRWEELGDGVLVRRYAELDLSVGLVLGGEQALVVDTRGDHVQGAELAEAVREVTSLPLQVIVTHGHFDHCFGTAAFLPAPVWAHERCVAHLERTASAQRDAWIEHYREQDRFDTAEALTETEPVVPDAGVVFVGDLVESGSPPDFEDAHPTQWPDTVEALLGPGRGIVVPGHGDSVGPGFVAAQRDELAVLALLCREVASGAIAETEALHRSPFPTDTTRLALRRAVH